MNAQILASEVDLSRHVAALRSAFTGHRGRVKSERHWRRTFMSGNTIRQPVKPNLPTSFRAWNWLPAFQRFQWYSNYRTTD